MEVTKILHFWLNDFKIFHLEYHIYFFLGCGIKIHS